MNEVTKDDLRDLRDSILDEMRMGFAGTHRRLDTTNGRVQRGELQGAAHDIKIKNLEAEVFRRRRADAGDASGDTPITLRRGIAGRAVTDRDVRVVWLTLGAVIAAAETGLRVVPALVKFAGLVKP